METRQQPLAQRVITQQGVNFTQKINAFDIYVRPTSVTRSGSALKTEVTAYYDDTSKWVLGQKASLTVNGILASNTTYFPASALPSATYSFGKLTAAYTFNPDGTLATLKDGLNHVTTFSGYMRGLAQHIAFSDGTVQDAVVNPLGLVTRLTNEAHTTWGYGYDLMGRLASKTPPGGDPVAYNTTTLSFVQVPTAEYGLEPGHWRQTITTGNAVTINYFDARWRKRLTTTYDAANIAATQRMQLFNYDPYSRTTFASYPARSIASVTATPAGTSTAYDALGRPVQTIADSELGPLTTKTDYLTGFQTHVTNPKGVLTSIDYQVFDDPEQILPALMGTSAGTITSFLRDIFGKPRALYRGGANANAKRFYVYDGNQRLCKTIDPETGATVQLLDAADNVSWRATGLNLPSIATCDTASVSAASKTAYSYDTRNRVTGTGFADGSPSIGRSYTADGLPLTVVSNGSTWTYGYNNRRLLTQETLNYGQSLGIGWGVDANGNTSSLTYPDGTTVAYSPDALGEATQVSGYAGGVSYQPNGAVAGYTLGNGIVHSQTQNVRGLPLQNRDAGVMQDLYGFDANANIASITDQQQGTNTRTMGYDVLDRLTSVSAPALWGTATYTYDGVDNLRTSTVGARMSTHNYDATTNRLSTIATNGVYTGYAYDAQGNVTARGTQGFHFDQGNRMTLALGKGTYTYDGLGRRTSITGADGSYRIQVYSQAGQLLYGTLQQGAVVQRTRYVYLGGKQIAETNSIGGTQYVHTDALGSPVARTNASGALINRTSYEPYGNTAAGTVPNELGFTGHVNDPDTGLVYMQQRYYDPIAGRFLSIDPITTDADTGARFNLYESAHSNPYRYTDPDGRVSRIIEDEGAGSGRLGEGGIRRGIDGGPVRTTKESATAELREAREASGTTEKSGVQANRAAGDAFQKEVAEARQKTQSDLVQEVTVKTESGVKTRIDIMSRGEDGKISCVECKSSSTAPLTKNQSAAFPQIERSGAVVVGNGKPGFPGGTKIPPTTVEIVRP